MAKTLLLADDSVTIQKVVGISFASEDIEIETVDNGHDAVARARELTPDIILADVVMPGLSGYDVCEAIKADAALAHIPVILLTGTFEAFDEARAQRVGAAGHVSKPFEAQTLVDRVNEMLVAAPPPVPAAQPAPPPAPAQAFEFTEDGDVADSGFASSGPGFDTAAEPLDFDESDSAFSFEEDDLAHALGEPPEAPPAVPLPPDATQLLPPTPIADDAPVEPSDVAQSTLLDPAGASGFDVSSSDLGPPASQDPVLARLSQTSQTRPDAASPSDAASPGSDFDEPRWPAEPSGGFEIEIAPAEPVADTAPEAQPAPPIDAPESDFASAAPPRAESDFASDAPPRAESDFASDAPPRAESDFASAAPEVLDPGATTDPFLEEQVPMAVAADPMATSPFEEDSFEAEVMPEVALPFESESSNALTPAMRRELSDTLEKVAWDAFGPVTEKIVALALERVEQVVWEVVPKLAETLIQEEIRRLKDGGDSE